MDDLTLLERVFLRIGSADTDEQLESVICKFLCPVLLKLASDDETIRKKVMELLIHVNKRVKSRPTVRLPIADLMQLYSDPTSSAFLTNFAIIYIKMGYPRMSTQEQSQLLPQLWKGLAGKPLQHKDSLMSIGLPAIAQVEVTTEAQQQLYSFLREKNELTLYIEQFLLDMLLLPYGLPHPSTVQPGQVLTVPPGMSESGFRRAAGESQWKPEQLEEIKLGIVKFVASGVFGEQATVPHLVIAAADTRFSIANASDSALKRIGGTVDWNDASVTANLFQLFLGNKTSKEPIRADHRRVPACTRLRLKLLSYLIRSREASTQFPYCVQVTFEGLFGENSNAKLKIMALQFLHQMIFNCAEPRLSPISPVLISGLMKIINDTQGDAKLRGSALVALGKLGQKLPEAVTKDMAIIQMLFNAMAQEEAETRMAVQEALSTMAPAFKNLNQTNAAILEALLATSLESEQHLLRLMAVQYCGVIFPAAHVTSRYLLLLASGDAKEEVRTEARKLLYANLPKTSADVSAAQADAAPVQLLPDFVDMVTCVSERAQTRLKSRYAVTYGSKTLPFDIGAFTEMLQYLQLCLASSSSMVPTLELLKEPESIGSTARTYLERLLLENCTVVTLYLDLALQLVTASPSKAPLESVLQVVASVPKLAPVLSGKIDVFKTLLGNSKEDVRELTAQILAVVACHAMDRSQLENFIADMSRNLRDKALELQQGSVLALGYTIGRLVRNRLSAVQVSRAEAEADCWNSLASALSPAVTCIVDLLNDQQVALAAAACLAVGEMARCGPLLDGRDANPPDRAVDRLLAITVDPKANGRIREKAALAAGFQPVGRMSHPKSRDIIETFLGAAQDIKDVEIQFTLGDALASAALGLCSSEGRDPWTCRPEEFRPPEPAAETQLEFLLEQLLTKYVIHAHPNVKQATSIWLLALVKKCPDRPEMKGRMQRLQRAFMSLLAEGGDFVQDVASKGLGLVFEGCTVEQQNQLAAELVGSLTTDKRPTMQVTGDTKVFEEGSLGANPSGGQLSTYRELCSLATDLNQPDLIYKFMHLASHNAIWNSKKGAAFGFGTIAKKAGQQLAPYLPEIVPKLYRYQFDPSPRVQQAMASIWEAIVSEQSKTLDLYFGAILDDLIVNLTSNLWRNRESSCCALADLLRGRALDDALDKIDPLWSTLFRVVDDIKESVRKAAQGALRALSKVCIKMVDSDSGRTSSSQRTIECLLPVLLDKGLGSTVEEVQAITLETLIKVVRSAGSLVSGHLAALVSALLEAAQHAEGASLNYLSVRLGNQHATQEKFDLARIAVAKSSSLFETVQHVMQFVSGDNCGPLASALVDLIKGTQGVPTKGCAAHVICLLSQQCQADIQPYAGRLMAVLVKGLSDRNVALRKTYAVALGHLVRVAKESSVVKLLETLENRYLEAEDDDGRGACLHTLQAMSRYNSDLVKSHAPRTAPLAFLGKHMFKQSPECGAELAAWEELWLEIVPGTEAGLRLYYSEIVAYLQRAITSPSWKLKAQAASAIGSMARSLRSVLEPAQRDSLLRILLDGLAGRTWDGKHHLLLALADICAAQSVTGTAFQEEIMYVVLRESRKEALPYRRYAVDVLGRVAESLDADIFAQTSEMLFPLFQPPPEGQEMEEEEEDRDEQRQAQLLELHEAAIATLGRTFPTGVEAQSQCWEPYVEILRITMLNTTRPVQLAIITSLAVVLERITSPEVLTPFQNQMHKILTTALDVANYVALRTQALKVLILLLRKPHPPLEQLREIYWLRAEEALRDPSPEIKSRADEARQLMRID